MIITMAIARRETCQQGWRWRWRRWRRPRRPPARDRWCSRWRRWTLTRTQINFYRLSRWFQRGKFWCSIYGKDKSEKDPNLPKNWNLHGQVLFYLPGWWATRTCLICPRQLSRKLKRFGHLRLFHFDLINQYLFWYFSEFIWTGNSLEGIPAPDPARPLNAAMEKIIVMIAMEIL